MEPVFMSTVRKKSKTNWNYTFLTISIVCFCGVFANFMSYRSPMEQFNGLFIGLGIFFGVVWYVLHRRLELPLNLYKDQSGNYSMILGLKDGNQISLKKITRMQPFFGRVFYGKGPKVKEIYLRLYDQDNQNILTLFYSKGVIHDSPDGFWELPEMELLMSEKGKNIYYCSDFQEIFYYLRMDNSIQITESFSSLSNQD